MSVGKLITAKIADFVEASRCMGHLQAIWNVRGGIDLAEYDIVFKAERGTGRAEFVRIPKCFAALFQLGVFSFALADVVKGEGGARAKVKLGYETAMLVGNSLEADRLAVEVATYPYGQRAFRVRAYVQVHGLLYFTVAPRHRVPRASTELWRTDGTKEGTTRVVWFDRAVIDSLIGLGDALYFMAIGEKGQELWKTEGTREKTVMVKSLAPYWESDLLNRGAGEFKGQLFFSGYRKDTSHETQLWKSDGTEGGTQLVKDLYPRIDPTRLEFLGEFRGALYFATDESSERRREDFLLWKTDGTAAGTVLVKKLPLPPKRKPRGWD